MRGYNKCILSGNIVRDPEIRYTTQKQKNAKFTLAIGKEWKDKQTGEKKTQTDFINIVAWGALADICERYVTKGRPLLVDGRINIREYEKDGQRRWITEIIAENILLLGSGNTANSYQPKEQSNFNGSAGMVGEYGLDFSDINASGVDVDIPF